MKKTGRILVMMLALMVAIGLGAAICMAQQDAVEEPASEATTEAAPAKVEAPKVTKEEAPMKSEVKNRLVVKGKIIKIGTGYYVRGETLPDEFMIVNPNVKILDSLNKKGKVVKIEGYTTVSADRLFIEKINGKKYRGDSGGNVQ